MSTTEQTRSNLVEQYQPDSPVGAEFLRLYHNLTDHQSTPGSKTYLVTSATVGEGKSTASCYLALTFATIKKKTLLIDGDLRRPTVHRAFDLYLEDGLVDVAEGKLPLARAYKETRLPCLHVLTAGRLSSSPSSYYEQGQVAAVLEQAKSRFDYIVVDCAPILAVADPLVLSPFVTGVLLVIKAGNTHRGLVKEASDILTRANAPVKGVVLNNIKDVLPYYYNRRYVYDYYSPNNRH